MARGDKLIQFKDGRLYDRIERRMKESGAGSMVEVIRRSLEVALLIDEINYPADQETIEHQNQRAKRLRRLLAPAIEELASLDQLPTGMLASLGTAIPGGGTASTAISSAADLDEPEDDDGLSQPI